MSLQRDMTDKCNCNCERMCIGKAKVTLLFCPHGLSSRYIAATVLSLVWLLVKKCIEGICVCWCYQALKPIRSMSIFFFNQINLQTPNVNYS